MYEIDSSCYIDEKFNLLNSEMRNNNRIKPKTIM